MAKKTTGKAQETNFTPAAGANGGNSGNGGTGNGNANASVAGRSGDTGSTTGARDSGDISSEEIAARAYEIYEREGRGDGRDMDHWLRAEQELRDERQQRATNPEARQEAPRSARQHQQTPGV